MVDDPDRPGDALEDGDGLRVVEPPLADHPPGPGAVVELLGGDP